MEPLPLKKLIRLINRGIVTRKSHGFKPIPYALDDGLLMGCPGKELYYSLPALSKKEQDHLVGPVLGMFPLSPISRSVHLSAFWRYFYGVFHKQGGLNNSIDVLQEWRNNELDWKHQFRFMTKFLTAARHYPYAKLVACEMHAHRVGDLFLLTGEDKYCEQMMRYYHLATRLAVIHKSNKNAFSAPFWCAKYLYEGGQYDLCFKFCIEFLKNATQFCRTSTVSGKFYQSVKMLRICASPDRWRKTCKMMSGCNNKIIAKLWSGVPKNQELHG